MRLSEAQRTGIDRRHADPMWPILTDPARRWPNTSTRSTAWTSRRRCSSSHASTIAKARASSTRARRVLNIEQNDRSIPGYHSLCDAITRD